VRAHDHLQFKVVDFFWGHVQFLSQESQQRWVVIFLNARSDSCLLVRFVVVELVRNQAEDRDELRLWVKFEAVVGTPVDLGFCKP
jgi:hypothetical protein